MTNRNISYLVPRYPSIQCWDDRIKLSGPRSKNLIDLESEEFTETMGDKIKVFLRLKPSTSNVESIYTVLSSTALQTEAPKESVSYKNVTNGVGKLIHKFTFTSILDQDITQADLFKKCAVKSLKKFLKGENYLLMAYGTTSAGKTFTMQGNVDHPGVIPRALDFVFKGLQNNIIPLCKYYPHQYNELIVPSEEQLKKNTCYKNFFLSLDLNKCQKYPEASHVTMQTTTSSSGFSDMYENMTFKEMQSRLTDTECSEIDLGSYKYAVWISMIEIYNEQVYDLLEVPNDRVGRTKLSFRDDEYGNTFIKNLRYVNVSSGHEAFQILQFGRNNLHFAPTALNNSSSRSHCIFTITLAKFLNHDSSYAVISRFSFCDLAGMERAKKTLNMKDRLVESKAINTSLSILVKCLTTIKENQNNKEKKLIPYRESKLTKLFRDAVTGKEQFSLIVNVTTEPNLFDETLNVLKFSAIAQKIVPQNIFAKPKVMRPLKKSRFSRFVTQSSYMGNTIDWDAESIEKFSVKEESVSSEVEELRNVIDKLKEELSKEKSLNEKIECDIRKELTSQFSEILKKQRENNLIRLESEKERLEEMYEEKEKRIIKYYEVLRKCKRKKMDDEDVTEYEDQEKKLKEAKKEIESLNNKISGLTEQMQSFTQQHNNVLCENSALKFTIVEKDRVIEEMKRTMEAKSAGENEFEVELKKQLEEAKKKMADYKTLLDEAASDYNELEENNKYLRNENDVLEQYLTEQRDVVADHSREIAEFQKILSQKTIIIEKLEETNEKLMSELKLAGENKNEKNLSNVIDSQTKELENLREQLREVSEKLSNKNTEYSASESEKENLKSELDKCRCEISSLKDAIKNLEKVDKCEKEIELERTISEMNDELESVKLESEILHKEKIVLEEKCVELNSEIESLQKVLKCKVEVAEKENIEMKNLFQENKRQVMDEFSKLSKKTDTLENELKNKTEESERENKVLKEVVATKETEIVKLKEEKEKMKKEFLLVKEDERMREKNKCVEMEMEREKYVENLTEKDEEIKKLKSELEKLTLEKHTTANRDETMTETEMAQNETSVKVGKNICLENLSLVSMGQPQSQIKSTRKKIDMLEESIHPSTIKHTRKCYKKLFAENDFDELTDLATSPIEVVKNFHFIFHFPFFSRKFQG
ncbi:rabkinesin-6, putative [Pediculus humanus corporis]|uniref:Rabkinesin-6, putative n=1 Tax=Pediculus humanus subsp. corporis TaxID=121224 RepID=E0W324_PEDHC|nr:rabkinesin-6, putative [Pediculus humanus corporis]EEB20030.1 rabkinesin-6, putative [Pediculus humanus corporis]